ncbi:MAG TPA: hypothetical protein PKA81_14720 [Clostridia bacterium]|nr:hypothetical protein [Clostridia bacterium]
MQDVFSHFREEKSNGICLHFMIVVQLRKDNQLMSLFFRVNAGFLPENVRSRHGVFAVISGEKMYFYELWGV